MAASDDFSRPLQFVSQPQQTRPGQAATLTTPVVTSTAVQQAWRHLLPLLPAQPEPLQDLPELPVVVQQVLQQLRQSQPDGNKVLSPAQLMPQLLSLLQFQPLQSNANVQTSGGALAVAIQLLLGHLAQKPQPAAHRLQAERYIGQVHAIAVGFQVGGDRALGQRQATAGLVDHDGRTMLRGRLRRRGTRPSDGGDAGRRRRRRTGRGHRASHTWLLRGERGTATRCR